MKKLVIAGFAGIGKTTLAELNPENVIDMEIRPYKYANYKTEYTLEEWYKMEHILNENFLQKYIKDVKNEIANGTHKIIFIWLTIDVLEMIAKEDMKCLVATWNDKEEGIKEYLENLYEKRGNPIEWRKKVINYLEVINSYVKEKRIEAIVLNKNENIEMKLRKMKLW